MLLAAAGSAQTSWLIRNATARTVTTSSITSEPSTEDVWFCVCMPRPYTMYRQYV
jgi:hypothetical protein